MDVAEVAQVLAIASELDQYGIEITPTRTDAWAMALADVDFHYASQAVVRHYQGDTRRISIADIIRIEQEIKLEENQARQREALREKAERSVGEYERAKLEAAPKPEVDPDERRRHIEALIAPYRNWNLIGDRGTRRAQARWSPALAERYEQRIAQAAQEEERKRLEEQGD